MSVIYVANYGDGTAAQANFASAYNDAVDGDTIVFPLNGSATWSASSIVSKTLTIDGNGTTLTAGTTLSGGVFRITGISGTTLMRVTGFVFQLVDFSGSVGVYIVSVGSGPNPLQNLRIDHNIFHFGYTQIVVEGCQGVIDNNLFYNSRKGIDFSAGSVLQANASWESMAAGTANALFIETNSFIDNASYPAVGYTQEKIGTENGGKLVVRYNTFNQNDIYDPSILCDAIMTHGSAPGGVSPYEGYWQQGFGARRGQSVVEIYNNVMSAPRLSKLCTLRGSANLVWGNSGTSTIGRPGIYLREEECQPTGGATQWSAVTTYAVDSIVFINQTGVNYYYTCNSGNNLNHQPPSFPWTSFAWNPPRFSWPAEDQVHNSFFWNNTSNGSPIVSGDFSIGDNASFIIQNRDYFIHAPEASGGFEYFSGLNGASNTYPTDGSTYPTSGTMLFSTTGANAYYGYVPFTYPHPLTGPFSRLTRMGRYPRFGVYHAF